MTNIQLLTAVRNLLTSAQTAVRIGEYKPQVICNELSVNLIRLEKLCIQSVPNRKEQAKQLKLIRSAKLSRDFENYDLVLSNVFVKITQLPSAIDFM